MSSESQILVNPNATPANVPKDVALQLRRICDSDEKFEERSVQYQIFIS